MQTVEEPSPKAEKASIEQLTAWLAVIATVGVPLYPLGLLILALQVKETYHLDFGSAWYAASQASNKAIIGVVIAYMGRNLGAIVFFLVLAMIATLWARFDTAKRPAGLQWIRNPRIRRWVARIGGAFRILIVVALAALTVAIFVYTLTTLGKLVLASQFIVGGVAAVLAMVEVRRSRPYFLVVAQLMALMFLGLGVASYLNADLGAPPLPPIAIAAENGATIHGRLVDHNGGFWYVLSEPDGELLALKDDAKVVTIAPRTPATPSVTRP